MLGPAISSSNPTKALNDAQLFGIGLRHEHYQQALTCPADIDFVEVHTENFFAPGGASAELIREISKHYELSLHCTAMGLGSIDRPSDSYMDTIARLNQEHKPLFLSDHASFNRAAINSDKSAKSVFTGDLLPLAFNREWLLALSDNVNYVQDKLGRQILVENLSSYFQYDEDEMMETDFLNQLVEKTNCGLLLDLNNILINAHNKQSSNPLHDAISWTESINLNAVQEIHLAGFSQDKVAGFYVDDHSQAVSDECWALYRNTIQRLGKVATLIEWDNSLPSWETLVAELNKARAIVSELESEHYLKQALPS